MEMTTLPRLGLQSNMNGELSPLPHLVLRHDPLSGVVVPLLEEGVPVDPPLRVDQDVLGAGHGESHAERIGPGEILQQLRHALEGLEIVDKF